MRGSTAFTSDDALQIAHLKTGSLFAFCGEAGALAARAPHAVVTALRDFGMRAGSAFQIADDLLDFESDAATLGKAVLADVTEGKPSLPLAIALKRLPPLREEMAELLKAGPETAEDDVRARVRAFAVRLSRTGALGAARRIAEKERDAALVALERVPHSPTRELLAQVARVLLEKSLTPMTPAPTSSLDAETGPKEQERRLLHEVADALGALMEFWGFKRVMGRVWTLLYLRGDALSASDLCDQLSISSGAASMALSELEHWAVIRRIRKAGDRREYFEAETDIWKMISRVLRERELVQIERALEVFERVREKLGTLAAPGERSRLEDIAERLGKLVDLARVGRHGATGARRSRPADAVPALAALELYGYPEPPGVVAEDQPAALVEVVQMRPPVLGEQRRPLDARVYVGLARQLHIQAVQVDGHSECSGVAVAPARAVPTLLRR